MDIHSATDLPGESHFLHNTPLLLCIICPFGCAAIQRHSSADGRKIMAYRNKVYVAFDGDTDIRYYWLMKAWKQNDGTSFNFFDAHDLNTARDTSQMETIRQKLRLRLQNSKVLLCLIGEHTRYLYKFVRWEIETAKSMNIALVGVNLNGSRAVDDLRCPPVLRDSLSLHIPYNQKLIAYALEDWPVDFNQRRMRKDVGACHYVQAVYTRLGID